MNVIVTTIILVYAYRIDLSRSFAVCMVLLQKEATGELVLNINYYVWIKVSP